MLVRPWDAFYPEEDGEPDDPDPAHLLGRVTPAVLASAMQDLWCRADPAVRAERLGAALGPAE